MNYPFARYGSRVGRSVVVLGTAAQLIGTGWAGETGSRHDQRGPVLTESFDAAGDAALPAGWSGAQTGTGEPRWRIVAESTAPSRPNVLRQDGVADYALCLKTNPLVADGWAEVKFKPVSGEKDQAGGLVWRVRDASNYYVVRANALETNVVPYKVVDGKRTALNLLGRPPGYGLNLPVPLGVWSTLRVEFTGTRHRVCFNGQPCFEVEDPTFTGAGHTGLWTKADSVTLFDDFRVGVTSP